MSDNALSRFAPRLAPAAPPNDGDPEGEENLGIYGHLRGVKERSLMLEIRRKDGSVVALSYALLDKVAFDGGVISLRFTCNEVRIVGQRLNEPAGHGLRLFDALIRHRATWIQEASRADALEGRANGPVIEAIEIR